MKNWYEENIEEGIRDLVRYLRNNGINTECSCGHEKYIQCQYVTDGAIMVLDALLFNYGLQDYEIELHLYRKDGFLRTTLNIKLG